MNRLLQERTLPSGQQLQLVQGDITAEQTDAIVNAANAHLQHGAGVAGAIVGRGGSLIQQESDEWVRQHGPVSHSRPAWTRGGALPAKYVIHAVGPVWGSGNEDDRLAAAVEGSLAVADELHCASVAMPALSTGIFGFPKGRAARLMFAAIHNYFATRISSIQQVRIVLFDDETLDAFQAKWEARKR